MFLTFKLFALRCVGPSPEVFVARLREIPSGRGEGPTYMKVPCIECSFKVISIHYCTVFVVGGFSELGGGCKNVFICICTSVSMCIFSRSSKTLYGTSEEEGLNRKFWILVFKDFGVGAKFGQKMKSVCWVEVVENGAESLGAYENTF